MRRLLPPCLALAAVVCGCPVKTVFPGGDDDTGAGDDDLWWPDDDDDTWASGCSDEDVVPDPDGSLFGPVSLADDLQPRIDAACDCHQQGDPSIADLSPGRTWSSWVARPSAYDPGELLVVPCQPGRSVVFWKVLACYPIYPYTGTPMPPNAAPLDAEELTLYYNWIAQGAADN